MSGEWKPGDVAMVTVEGFKPEVAVFTESGRWHDASDTSLDDRSPDSTYRPLVVIDPEDRESVERLMRVVRDRTSTAGDTYPGMTKFADEMQAALREYANPKPPRPDEPQGLGAVVQREDGSRWVLGAKGWTNLDASGRFLNWSNWSDVNELSDVVRVLSPGVEVDQ